MQPKDFKALMLRTCAADMTAHNGFKWPESGWCQAPDWKPTEECGNGLHGALWGEGDGSLFNWDPDAKWMVCGIDEWVDIGGKVKAPRAYVLFCGDRKDATDYIIAHGARGAVIGGTATAGDYGTATAGDRGTATAGYGGAATAGDYGTATAGDSGTATAGDSGTATAGDSGAATAGYRGTATAGYRGTATTGNGGTATAGDEGTATAGYRGTATAGDGGTATAGYRGTATAGNGGTATAGDEGTATAGDEGTATAGDEGMVCIKWWDGNRCRMAVGYAGEDGIEPNVAYRCDAGKLVKA